MLASFLIGHNPLRSGDDSDTETAEDLRDVIALAVYSETWLGDSLQTGDYTFTVWTVLQSHNNFALNIIFNYFEVLNETFVFEDFS